ncbi:hypothetical protein D9M68_692670 [compost metagenome]
MPRILQRPDRFKPHACRRRRAGHGENAFELGQGVRIGVSEQRHVVMHVAAITRPDPAQRNEIRQQQGPTRIFDMEGRKTKQQTGKGQCHGQPDQAVTFHRRQVQRAVEQHERRQVGRHRPQQRAREDVGDQAGAVRGFGKDRAEREQR